VDPVTARGARPAGARRRSRRRTREPDLAELRLESTAQALSARGLPTWLQPTTAHRGLAGPVLLHLALAGASLGLALAHHPLLGLLLFFLQLPNLLIDLDGGQSPVRRWLPRSPGWSAEIELQEGEESAATLLVFLPMNPGGGARRSQAQGPQLAQAALALAQAVVDRPIPGARVLLLLGADGPTWFDDLDVLLRNRRHRSNPRRCALLVLRPSASTATLINPDGVVRARSAPPGMLTALGPLGLPSRRGRSAAARARRLGVPAIGLSLDPARPEELADRLHVALRCLGSHLSPESA